VLDAMPISSSPSKRRPSWSSTFGEHPVVGRLQLALFLRVVGRRDERVVDHHAEQRVLRAFLGARRGAHRRRHRRRDRTSCRRARARGTAGAAEVRHVREPRLGAGRAIRDEVERAGR
jgi:hypothetical protein